MADDPRAASGDGMVIRDSREADIAAITALYGYHVCHGLASFEETPPDAEEIGRRRGEIVARSLPYLVAERGGRVVGYCYAAPFRLRSAYRFTLEDSVYVDAAEIRRGIGRRERARARVLFVGGRFAQKGGEDLLHALDGLLGEQVELDLVTPAEVAPRPGLRVHRLESADPELLERLSPWSRLDAIRAPLFIEHGRNDPRVPVGESEAIHRELVARGIRCELVIYEDEGHMVEKLPNRIDVFERAVAFLDEVLG